MGPLSGRRLRPAPGRATRDAAAAVVGALLVVGAVVALGGAPPVVLAAVLGAALVALGVVIGQGGAVVAGGALQLGAGATALVVDVPEGAGPRPVALVVGLLVWATVELAGASLDRRPDSTPTAAARLSQAGDLLVVVVAASAIGGVALLTPGLALSLPLDVRLGALVATVAALAAAWRISRPRRARRPARGPAARG